RAALLLQTVGAQDPGHLVAALQALAGAGSGRVFASGKAALLAGNDRAALDGAVGRRRAVMARAGWRRAARAIARRLGERGAAKGKGENQSVGCAHASLHG